MAGRQQFRQGGRGQQAAGYFPPSVYYSVDVECVATGTDHNARAVAQIAVVDQYEQVRRLGSQPPPARRRPARTAAPAVKEAAVGAAKQAGSC